MATLFSTLAWKIPWTEEPGGLQSMGLPRVRYDRVIEDTHTQQTSQVNELGSILCMERCKSLGSLESFLWYTLNLSGASIFCLSILSAPWVHIWGRLAVAAGLMAAFSVYCLLMWQVTCLSAVTGKYPQWGEGRRAMLFQSLLPVWLQAHEPSTTSAFSPGKRQGD